MLCRNTDFMIIPSNFIFPSCLTTKLNICIHLLTQEMAYNLRPNDDATLICKHMSADCYVQVHCLYFVP